jgi:hypothetical protein
MMVLATRVITWNERKVKSSPAGGFVEREATVEVRGPQVPGIGHSVGKKKKR